MVSKRGLLLMSSLLWSIAGFNVLRKGLTALVEVHPWWIIVLAMVIGSGFLMMFRKIVSNYSERIVGLVGKRFPLYHFMSKKGYLVIGLMMTLGVTMAFIPNMPQAFFASFYTGLGAGLNYGAIQFFINSITLTRNDNSI